MTTTTKVQVKVSHSAHGRQTAWWVEPVGWTPEIPMEFRGEQYVMEDGSIWGSEEEEAALVYFGATEPDETIAVNLEDLNWCYTGTSSIQRLDDPFVKVAAE
jgi:hypothetical protein